MLNTIRAGTKHFASVDAFKFTADNRAAFLAETRQHRLRNFHRRAFGFGRIKIARAVLQACD